MKQKSNTYKNCAWRGLVLAMAGVASLGFTGCSKGGGETPPPAAGEEVTFAFVTNASADFWSYGEAGCKKAEQDFPGIKVIFKAGDGTSAKQKQIVDDLISAGVKGIAISITDPAAQTAMVNEWAKQVPVLCCDSDAAESNRIAYLGTDNIAAGRKVGELVKEALPDGGKIMVYVGLRDQANAVERFQGMKEAIADTKIEVIDLMTDEVDFAKAKRNVENTLSGHPEVKALVGLWEYNPPMILSALKDADKLGEIKVIGFDENFATLRAIDEGHCTGTVVQQPYEFGYRSIKMLHDIVVDGKKPEELGIPENKLIYVDTKVIKKGKGAEYLAYCQGLLDSVK